jgi:oligopeptide/dipeptide ABC transporter ATP-binding protein
MSEPVLQISELVTTFPAGKGRAPVVDHVSLSVDAGKVLAVVGESGCGKSITAMSVMRLVPKPGRIESGSVRLLGQELLGLPVTEMRKVRAGQISMIFQEPMTSLNPVMTAGSQVVEAIRLNEKVSKAAARARTLSLFKQVGIPDAEDRLDAYPHQLSGGLKQRVMIAMALSTRPKLLIADEPTTALDVTIQAQILELLRELQRESKTAILLITHDLGVVNQMADRIAVMYAGRVAEEADRVDLLSNPRHPYTEGLLSSIPARNRPGERLYEIEGVVPSPANWPEGCRFCTRCRRAFDPCQKQIPVRTNLSATHEVYCHAVERDEGANA